MVGPCPMTEANTKCFPAKDRMGAGDTEQRTRFLGVVASHVKRKDQGVKSGRRTSFEKNQQTVASKVFRNICEPDPGSRTTTPLAKQV